MIQNEARFQELIEEAAKAEFSGWDFSWMQGRSFEPDLFWSYRELVQANMVGARSVLDMGTGGGEFLASFAPFELEVSATESYPPNIPIAKERLEPFGVKVYGLEHETQLPIPDKSFDLVINRHEIYDINEVKRVLRPDGIFLTQQVGGTNDQELVFDLTGKALDDHNWYLDTEVKTFTDAGFEIVKKAESFEFQRYFDVGAVVYYARIIAWLVPDFNIETYREQLGKIQNQIVETGTYLSSSHRFVIEAKNTA